MTVIDSHSHLFLEEFSSDLPQVIERARMAGVSHIFMPNIDSSTVTPLLEVCNQYKGYCFPMIRLHPTSVNGMYKHELQEISRQLKENETYVAVGEVGMDLYWDQTFLDEQIEAFKFQIELALQYNLPIVIHCRDAFSYIYKVLKEYEGSSLKGIFHSFMGTPEELNQAMEFGGFMFGINGTVTFKKSVLPQILPLIPLDRLVLETDSPYLAPVPHRGKRNESAFIKDTLTKVAEVCKVSPEHLSQLTSENALKVFGMLK